MRKISLRILKRAILVMAPFIFIACEKSASELGFNQVIGGVSDLETDTFAAHTYTKKLDSIAVVLAYNDQLLIGGYVGNRLVGSVVDGVFGRSQAALVSQLFLEGVAPDFGTNPIVDSVSLYLRYNGIYGDSTLPMDLEVYELAEGLSRDSVYYSSYKPVLGNKIGEKVNFYPRPNSKVVIEENDALPVLKIPMDKNYFQTVIADNANGNFESFSSQEDFIDYFKGIVVKTPTEKGSMLYFNTSTAYTKVAIYYHNDEDTLSFDLNYALNSTASPINFSVFSHDYSGTYPVGFDVSEGADTSINQATTYVEAMSGVTTVLKIPGLDSLISRAQNEEILINKAFLDIYKKRGTGFGMKPPASLEIREYDTISYGSTIKDFSSSYSSEGDGSYNSEDFKDGYYTVNITRHLFELVNGKNNIGLMILPRFKSTVADRVILEGGASNDRPVFLKVYYTKLKD